jgi:hypothetical protein
MSLRAPSPKNVSLHVMEDRFFRASVNRQEHFLHVIRSEHGFESADEARQIHKHLVAAVEPYVRFRVLIDLRKAKGNYGQRDRAMRFARCGSRCWCSLIHSP